MQRVQLEEDEKLTRKEYLKRKKKQSSNIRKKKSKLTYITFFLVAVVGIYLIAQIYVYSKENNFKYVEDELSKAQKVYNVYYVTEGYTYNPVYTLNSIYSNGFEDKIVYSNSGLTNIKISGDYIYGTKEGGLYRLKKKGDEIEPLIEKDLEKFNVYGDFVYYTQGSNNALKSFNVNTKEIRDLGIDNIVEIAIDENFLFVVKDETTQKTIYRLNKEGKDKKELTKKSNVSYIIQSADKIYFVNKKDSNKIYSVTKNGENESKVADIKTSSDSGQIKEIDGSKYMFIRNNELYYVNVEDTNKLFKINLETKAVEEVLPMSVELLQGIDETVFYKIKGEMGIYLYNLDTKFMSQITNRKLRDFYVDISEQISLEELKNKK